MSDGNYFRDLRLHWLHIAEGKSEQTFEEVVLTEVVVTLVADLKEVPYLFQGFSIQDVVSRGIAKSKEKLNLSLFVVSAPFSIGLRVRSGVRCRCSAINHIPESLVFEDQGNHLAPVYIVIPIVIEERNLILDVQKWWLSRHGRGDSSSLGGGSGVVLCGGVGCLCARAGRCISGVCMTAASGTGTTSGHRHQGMGRRGRHWR